MGRGHQYQHEGKSTAKHDDDPNTKMQQETTESRKRRELQRSWQPNSSQRHTTLSLTRKSKEENETTKDKQQTNDTNKHSKRQ